MTPTTPTTPPVSAGATNADPPTKRRLSVLFATYLVLLVWVVLWKLDLPWIGVHRLIKLVPFAPVGDEGPSEAYEIAINFFLFLPFGVYLRLVAPAWRWWRATAVFAASSVVLEAAQYVLGVGSSDVTDVVVNVAGGLAGVALVALAQRGLGARADAVVMRICTIGTVIALVGSALFIAAPLHYGRPPDGDRLAPARLPD